MWLPFEGLSLAELIVLRDLKRRHLEDWVDGADHFSPRELARLRFLRWLRRAGRLRS